MTYTEIIAKLKLMANPHNVEGMAHFGITGKQVLGISVVRIRQLAKEIGKDHKLAEQLWDSGIHEARILASIIADKHQVTESLMEKWVRDIDSWDVCDQVMGNLFCYSPLALSKIHEWSTREPEFEKRSAFSLLAYVTVHRKKDVSDADLEQLLPLIEAASTDPRNFVKKAVNWALRQIGKHSAYLHAPALRLARKLADSEDKTARWIGKDAVRELETRNPA